MRKLTLVTLSLLVAVSMLLAACQPTPGAVQTIIVEGTPMVVTATPEPVVASEFKSKDPTTWVEVTFGDPETLDPAFDYETGGGGVLMQVYDTLVWYDKADAAKFVPQLATEVPSLENGGISADGKTVVFKIRPGVKFHDGTDLTASDVAYTFQRGLLQGGTASPQWLFTEPVYGSGVYDVAEVLDPTGAIDDDAEAVKAFDPAALKAACDKTVAAIAPDDAAMTVTFNLGARWDPANSGSRLRLTLVLPSVVESKE
jgi:peptide/nickel transport system substrate-binding protein